MGHYLAVTTGEKGHLNPMVGVVQALQAEGDRVSWLCLPVPAPQLASLGVQIVALPPPTGDELVTQGPALAELVVDEPRLARWIEQLLLDAVPHAIEPMRAILRQVQPDVVVLDPMLYAAILASHLEGIPYVAVSSSLNPVTPDDWDVPLTRMLQGLAAKRQDLFARHGLSPTFKVADCLSPYGTMVFTTPEYVGDVPIPPETFLVGPSVPLSARGDEVDFPWDRLHDDRRTVYASFGSQISWQPEVFGAIADATAGMDVDLVLSCGGLSHTPWAAGLPSHVVAVDYVPQRAMLQRTSVFVTHGGANSVMEALLAGVLIVMAPVCNDQWLQSRFLCQRQAGEVLLGRTRDSNVWQSVLETALDPAHPARDVVRRVSESYRQANGSVVAAQRIREVAARRNPSART